MPYSGIINFKEYDFRLNLKYTTLASFHVLANSQLDMVHMVLSFCSV
jgi:hypothetical protein